MSHGHVVKGVIIRKVLIVTPHGPLPHFCRVGRMMMTTRSLGTKQSNSRLSHGRNGFSLLQEDAFVA